MTAYARILRAVVEADDGHDAADAVVALGETRYLCDHCQDRWRTPAPAMRSAHRQRCSGLPRRVLIIDDPESA